MLNVMLQPQGSNQQIFPIQPIQIPFQQYSTVDIFQSTMNSLDNTIRANHPPISNIQKEISEGHVVKHLYLDETIVHSGQSTIFSHLTRLLKAHHEKVSNGKQKVGMDIDLSQLA